MRWAVKRAALDLADPESPLLPPPVLATEEQSVSEPEPEQPPPSDESESAACTVKSAQIR
jgi:hypothetical protein